jgi:hypothetical protein
MWKIMTLLYLKLNIYTAQRARERFLAQMSCLWYQKPQLSARVRKGSRPSENYATNSIKVLIDCLLLDRSVCKTNQQTVLPRFSLCLPHKIAKTKATMLLCVFALRLRSKGNKEIKNL